MNAEVEAGTAEHHQVEGLQVTGATRPYYTRRGLLNPPTVRSEGRGLRTAPTEASLEN